MRSAERQNKYVRVAYFHGQVVAIARLTRLRIRLVYSIVKHFSSLSFFCFLFSSFSDEASKLH